MTIKTVFNNGDNGLSRGHRLKSNVLMRLYFCLPLHVHLYLYKLIPRFNIESISYRNGSLIYPKRPCTQQMLVISTNYIKIVRVTKSIYLQQHHTDFVISSLEKHS